MSNLMTIAAAGVHASAARYDTAAINVVKATAPGSTSDLATAVVGETTAGIAFKANLAVFKMADRMRGKLLDVMA